MNLSRALAILFALSVTALSLGPAFSQSSIGIVSQPFSLNGVGQSSPVLNLSGWQSTCAITIYSSGVGLTGVPQTASDGPTNPQTWSTATGINSGSITTFGTYSGNIGGVAPTNFRFIVTALSSGTVSGVETCGPSLSAAVTVSGTLTANQGAANTATNAWPFKLTDPAGVNQANVNAQGQLQTSNNLAGTAVATAQPGQAKTAVCDPVSIANCQNMAAVGPAGAVAGYVTLANNGFQPNVFNLNGGSQSTGNYGLAAAAHLYAYNSAGMDPLRTTQAQGDTRTGILAIGACNAAPGANQCASVGGQADGQTGSLINGLATNSFLYSFNGTTLDRLRTTQAITGTGVGRLSTGVCDPTNALCLNVPTTGGSRNNSGLASFAAQDSTGLNEIDAADKSFTQTITTNTTTLLIAAVAAKTQYLTSIDATVVSTTAGSLALKYGTQTTTPCDTGAVTLATYQFAANTPLAISRGSGLGSIVQPPPANNQECITTAGLTGTASINGSFAQF